MAIDRASVDWGSARRASYLLRQSFRYEYPEPIRDLNHRLVVIPPERFGDQRRLRHEVSVDLEGVRLEDRRDRFGNVIFEVFAPRVSRVIEFTAEVSVERHAEEPNRLPTAGSPTATWSNRLRSQRRTIEFGTLPTSSRPRPSGACHWQTSSTTGCTSR